MKRIYQSVVAGFAIIAFTLSGSISPSLATPFRTDLSPSELLDSLEVKAETASGTYSRSLFEHWIDADGDGCDTRVEVLQEESVKPIGCNLKGGSWISLYDGLKVTNASLLDIDHFVPLKEAWESGAYSWNAETRKRFANDLDYSMSLIAVSAKTNRSKSDRDPASWLPPSAGFVCQYVGRWVAVKYRWSLSVDLAERNVLASKLKACGLKAKVEIPTKASIVLGVVATPTPSLTPTPTPKPTISATPTPSPSVTAAPKVTATPQPSASTRALDPKFASCAEAKRNGYKRPYVRGINPEYYYYKDGDGDGVVCE